MPKKDALSLGYQDWVAEMEALGEKRFRADQICGWLYGKHVFEWQLMSDIGLEMRKKLEELFRVEIPRLEKVVSSRRDGTKKFLWDFGGSSVESVAIVHPGRLTACISSQVGCPLGCPFCATGQSGFERNMAVGEMVGQFLAMEARLGEIKNLVFMGMGEPMLNYDNVMGAVRNLNHPKMRGLGIRHITISTSGVVPGILRLAKDGLGVRLAVSLHAPNDDLRDLLVPINAQYPLKELKGALKAYQDATGDRVTIEYSLFDKVNDSASMARQLGEYLRGLSVFVNLIPGSCTGDGRYVTSPPFRVNAFAEILSSMGYQVAVRMSKGSDVGGACGQLRRRHEAAKTQEGAQRSPREESLGRGQGKPSFSPSRPGTSGRVNSSRPQGIPADGAEGRGRSGGASSRALGGVLDAPGKRRESLPKAASDRGSKPKPPAGSGGGKLSRPGASGGMDEAPKGRHGRKGGPRRSSKGEGGRGSHSPSLGGSSKGSRGQGKERGRRG